MMCDCVSSDTRQRGQLGLWAGRCRCNFAAVSNHWKDSFVMNCLRSGSLDVAWPKDCRSMFM